VIVSHRRHAWNDAAIELDRALFSNAVFRRVRLAGVVDDERLLPTSIGRGIPGRRTRLHVVLTGRATAWAGGQCWELGPGDALVVRPVATLVGRSSDGESLEMDWDSLTDAPLVEHLRVSPRLLVSSAALSAALADLAAPDAVARLVKAGRDFLRVAAADGLDTPIDPDELATSGPDAQRLMHVIDGALSQLHTNPSTVDLETTLAVSRRTLTRHVRRVHTAYGLCGLGDGVDWKSIRDFYRLRVASILMSNPRAGTREIARAVGYGSPDAMCHAFAHVGLPSPGRVRETVR
jgi:AraC-like DNA-binding protein